MSEEAGKWVPDGVDLSRASAARMYDFWLGGSHNFAVDRELGQRILEAEPLVARSAQANRAFLRRAVRWCVDQGIRQFLDLGSGIPTVGNVHEIAQHAAPDARVAYVDNEPVAVAHARTMLADNPNASVTLEDLRRPDAVLTTPNVTDLLDFDRPVALLALLVLQYFPDDAEVTSFLARYRQRLAAGSYLVVSHVTDDDPELNFADATRLSEGANNPTHARTRAEVAKLVEGSELVAPGVTFVHEWRPDDDEHEPRHTGVYGAIGRL